MKKEEVGSTVSATLADLTMMIARARSAAQIDFLLASC